MTRATVPVALGDRSYDIHIGPTALAESGGLIKPLLKRNKIVVISDETVAGLHLETLQGSLDRAGIAHDAIVLPPGEGTKSFDQLSALLDRLFEIGIERSTTLIALGGGVIGDLVGFTAAIALRGIDFIQIPTTLLAQVDSSVGGKTGINVPAGKNLVGAFHQPRLVLADTGVLDTLSPRELRAGYAEIVKYGAIDDFPFFQWLETHGADLLAGDLAARIEAVQVSCAAKARIVAEDEREADRRALLNFGHTFGHALESATGYSSRLLHGESVAIGMAMAFDLSARLGLCDGQDAARFARHLAELGLPTGPTSVPGMTWNAQDLVARMATDKKVKDGRLTFILSHGIGKAFVTQDVRVEDLTACIEEAIAA
ncbi:3-dehydroquinate synthase [Rhodospirillaceae bacterium KN72]|uniref:3-dehydroquinate synthase n=1 Tax=Pacificispira spongiicola TaxID=2729598 RepID=A0A7Y0HGG5_9PROT|nr:3-dehydroquinate synthase [Pacificispira spongiicola]NMM44902.1 3-dehydroquinate synthase [Pacificispira spongiicola]